MERAQVDELKKILRENQGQTPISIKQPKEPSAAKRLLATDDKPSHEEQEGINQDQKVHNWETDGHGIELLKACDREPCWSLYDQSTPLIGVLTTLPLISERRV